MSEDKVKKSMLKAAVNGFYSIQKTRIRVGNNIVANFKIKLGQEPSSPETDLDADAKLLLKNLRESYKKITDGVVSMTPRQFKKDGLISDFSEFALVQQYDRLVTNEDEALKQLKYSVRDFDIYNNFLEDVTGVGPTLAAVIISGFDIHKAEYASSLWAYAGLDVVKGAGRSRKKEHLIETTYMDAEGKEQTKMGISFNPFLKTKLIGVLGSSFVKTNGKYREIYDNYKHRISNMPAHAEKSKGHLNNMAIRYAVKRFLVDLYYNWRTMEGLPIAAEYSEAKLKMVHGKAA
jgi:hypothetical protein|tara:strand:+ start:265 stop:1137 length:873 start_codon:yes stop_codon:yes gene_type:complete